MDNVNYKILLQQHNGNEARARAAWAQICGLGGYGAVPFEYEGGLDVGGLRVLADERRQGQAQAIAFNMTSQAYGTDVHHAPQQLPEPASDLEDRIKRIEDIASGDKPKEN